ncbi:protein archease [Halobacteriales archaeon QS_9_68_42]|nr:MAG: protein archease [Halobacteriales archaeon QS_9_68_42]
MAGEFSLRAHTADVAVEATGDTLGEAFAAAADGLTAAHCESVLPADHEADVHWNGSWVVEASARGVPLAAVEAREIKAVTYSEMEIVETDGGWRIYVVFDV